MKVAVVGGGISGLYSANLLCSLGYEVEIYEGNQWGGDIQTATVGNTCYPVSTLFVMPDDDILKDELKKYNIGKGMEWSPYNKYIMGILIFLFGVSLGCSILYNFKYLIGSIVLLMLILITTYITGCRVLLGFGGDNKCGIKKVMTSIPYVYNYFDKFELLEDCEFSKLCSAYLNNPGISYVNKYVNKIYYNNGQYVVISDNNINRFDKVLIACTYESYSKIINLTQEETEVLGNMKYFDFYTTLVVPNNSGKFDAKFDSVGSIKLKDAKLFGSHKPLNLKSIKNTAVRNFSWKMPINIGSMSINQKRKQKLNDKLKNVYFIGKEMTDLNGVNYCMKYAKEIIDKYF